MMANGHGVHDDEHGGSLGSGGSLRSQKLKESFREKLKELKEHAHLPHMHLSNLSLKRSSHQEPAHMSHEGTPRRGKRKQLKKGRKSNDMNDWGMTFDEEMEVLNEFQDELKGEEGVRKDHLIDEKKLLRFLKARNFDIDKAKEMFLKHLKWREEWDVDNILFQEFPEREQLLQYFPQGYHMCDKQGRPIYIQYLGGINIHKILSFTDEETIVKLFIQEYEKFQHYKLPACSEAQGKLIETSLNIMDVSGISLKILTKESQRIMKKVTGFTQDNYPEMMGNTVIINAPYIFKVIFNIVKPMLSARTQSKITMVGTRYLDKLLEFADISCLPKRLGGTSEFTIFDDVGPWTRIAPSISSKHQLDLYQSQQMSRWNRSGAEGKSPAAEISLRAIPSTSSFYSESEEVSADYFFTSREGGGDGIDVAEKRRGPNLLSWVQALEKDVEDLCRDYSVGESSQRKERTSSVNTEYLLALNAPSSLVGRLEHMETRMNTLLDIYPTVVNGDQGQEQKWNFQGVELGSSSILTRICNLEDKVSATKAQSHTFGVESKKNSVGGLSWFACCYGHSLSRSLSIPETP